MTNRIGKLCIAAAVMLFLVMHSCLCVFALVPDLQRKCSVTFTMNYNGAPIEGGTLQMYRIATWTVRNGAYDFKWTYELSGAGLNLAEKNSETFARHVSMLVESLSLPAIERPVDANGKAMFDNLECGLYVVYQTQPPKGYEPINAFCISLPMVVDGELVYDVKASPKPRVENPTVTTPDTSNPPQTTSAITTTTAVQDSEQKERLPQTGQLWWPSWLIGAVGLALFGFGFVLRFMYRDDAEESGI